MSIPKPIFSLVYISTASNLYKESELAKILKGARSNNSNLGISGMLLCKDGSFLQVLEGDETQVKMLFQKISRDSRHKGVTIVHQSSSDQREFPDWSMGFRDLRSSDVSSIPGYSHFMESPLSVGDFAKDPSRAKQLLLLFKNEKGTSAKSSG